MTFLAIDYEAAVRLLNLLALLYIYASRISINGHNKDKDEYCEELYKVTNAGNLTTHTNNKESHPVCYQDQCNTLQCGNDADNKSKGYDILKVEHE